VPVAHERGEGIEARRAACRPGEGDSLSAEARIERSVREQAGQPRHPALRCCSAYHQMPVWQREQRGVVRQGGRSRGDLPFLPKELSSVPFAFKRMTTMWWARTACRSEWQRRRSSPPAQRGSRGHACRLSSCGPGRRTGARNPCRSSSNRRALVGGEVAVLAEALYDLSALVELRDDQGRLIVHYADDVRPSESDPSIRQEGGFGPAEVVHPMREAPLEHVEGPADDPSLPKDESSEPFGSRRTTWA